MDGLRREAREAKTELKRVAAQHEAAAASSALEAARREAELRAEAEAARQESAATTNRLTAEVARADRMREDVDKAKAAEAALAKEVKVSCITVFKCSSDQDLL